MALRTTVLDSILYTSSQSLVRNPQLLPPLHRRCAEFLAKPFTALLPWTTDDIWEWVLKAVPKKKTTHSKTRSRQMAGKALKDVTALNKCPGCGRTKRAHTLCAYCLFDVRTLFKRSQELEHEQREAIKADEGNASGLKQQLDEIRQTYKDEVGAAVTTGRPAEGSVG